MNEPKLKVGMIIDRHNSGENFAVQFSLYKERRRKRKKIRMLSSALQHCVV
jgi:hypothetical protein